MQAEIVSSGNGIPEQGNTTAGKTEVSAALPSVKTNLEIEGKWLLHYVPRYILDSKPVLIRQGYIAISDDKEVRLRREGSDFFLTVKSGGGAARPETNISISEEQFNQLWPTTEGARLEKYRYTVGREGVCYQVDIYLGALERLKVVEVEFPTIEELRSFKKPEWFHTDVTEDTAYKNKNLARKGRPKF